MIIIAYLYRHSNFQFVALWKKNNRNYGIYISLTDSFSQNGQAALYFAVSEGLALVLNNTLTTSTFP